MFGREGASSVSENHETEASEPTIDPEDLARLRTAFAYWEAEEKSSGEEGEIDAARIFDAVQGELPPEERLAIIERLAIDPDAALAWRLAADLVPPAEESSRTEAERSPLAPVVPLMRPVRETRREASAPRWRWLAAAAAVVFAVVAVWQFQNRTVADPTYRGTEGKVVESALPRDAKLPRENALLRWKEIAGATYRVRVFAQDLKNLAEGEDLRSAEFLIPQGALVDVPRGGRVLWKVEAVVPGEGKRSSPTFSSVIE